MRYPPPHAAVPDGGSTARPALRSAPRAGVAVQTRPYPAAVAVEPHASYACSPKEQPMAKKKTGSKKAHAKRATTKKAVKKAAMKKATKKGTKKVSKKAAKKAPTKKSNKRAAKKVVTPKPAQLELPPQAKNATAADSAATQPTQPTLDLGNIQPSSVPPPGPT